MNYAAKVKKLGTYKRWSLYVATNPDGTHDLLGFLPGTSYRAGNAPEWEVDGDQPDGGIREMREFIDYYNS